MDLISFIWEYRYIIGFYVVIALLIYTFKSRLEFQGKFIALYKTKWGIALMEKASKNYGPMIRLLGYIGIGVGFIGMITMSFFILKGFYDLFFVPEAPPVVSPVIPGVKIPGASIYVPFWFGIISLFITVVVHEFAHGIVAIAHKEKIKSSGLAMIGPFPGAFVEADEKKLRKRDDVVKYSIFAAGPFSNVILALIALVLLNFVMGPISSSITQTDGIVFEGISEGYPAEEAGLTAYTVYDTVNGDPVNTREDFYELMKFTRPNESMEIGGPNGSHLVTLTTHPENERNGYLGVVNTKTNFVRRDGVPQWVAILSNWVSELLLWILILSSGIGLANLLPIGPVDGGRMLHTALLSMVQKKKADVVFTKVTLSFLLLLLILLLAPIAKSIV